jgi:hypothetical protein
MLPGPVTRLGHKSSTKTSATVIGMNIDLAQVGFVSGKHFDV